MIMSWSIAKIISWLLFTWIRIWEVLHFLIFRLVNFLLPRAVSNILINYSIVFILRKCYLNEVNSSSLFICLVINFILTSWTIGYIPKKILRINYSKSSKQHR